MSVANCAQPGADPNAWDVVELSGTPDKGEQLRALRARARRLCDRCPILVACAHLALNDPLARGTYGGVYIGRKRADALPALNRIAGRSAAA